MKRLQWLTILMSLTLAVIAGFQVYWLKENYDREKKAMEIKAGVIFQETVQQLQASKLKLPGVFLRTKSSGLKKDIHYNESLPEKKEVVKNEKVTDNGTIIRKTFSSSQDSGKKQIIISIEGDSNGILKTTMPIQHGILDTGKVKKIYFEEEFGSNSANRRQIVTMVNTIRTRMSDSTGNDSLRGRTMVLRTGEPKKRQPSALRVPKAANNDYLMRVLDDSNNHALRVLYTVDSLQDSLTIPEITSAYSRAIVKQDLNIPFTISKDTVVRYGDEDLMVKTVGFAYPKTYRLTLIDTNPYLFKKLSLPALFSLFLVGVTIFSFVLLYRNLMRQQRLSEIKNDFISNITHELKTPIATVGVAIEALKNFNAMHDPQKTKEYLDISANELQRLSLLVDKVLKLSMFEKKEIELNTEHFDMKALTSEVLDTMRLQFEKNHAVVNFSTTGESFMVNADKLHITSVIYNLLDNALKYRKGEPVIDVQLASQKELITLTVTDNGIGIAPEYQPRIFDKFFRVPTGNKHVVKGYGLGLSYVSHIMKQHKGSINVISEINHGSTFTIKLPVHG